MGDRGDFLAGVFVGAIMGFVVGVVMAPASGQETLGKIRERTEEVGLKGKAMASEVVQKVRAKAMETAEVIRNHVPLECCCESESED